MDLNERSTEIMASAKKAAVDAGMGEPGSAYPFIAGRLAYTLAQAEQEIDQLKKEAEEKQ